VAGSSEIVLPPETSVWWCTRELKEPVLIEKRNMPDGPNSRATFLHVRSTDGCKWYRVIAHDRLLCKTCDSVTRHVRLERSLRPRNVNIQSPTT
jgi:hypothetical protein